MSSLTLHPRGHCLGHQISPFAEIAPCDYNTCTVQYNYGHHYDATTIDYKIQRLNFWETVIGTTMVWDLHFVLDDFGV